MFGLVITFESVAHAVVAAMSSAVILLVTMNFFQSRPEGKDPNSPASFLELNELISGKNLRGLALFFSAPFALLFLVVAIESATFVEVGREYLITNLVSMISDTNNKDALKALLEGIPSYLSPLFVLVATLALFAPYIRAPFEWFRNLVITATGIDARADSASLDAAEAALVANTAEVVQRSLESLFGSRAPLPIELTHASDKTRIAYQILYFSRDDTKEDGLEVAINNTLRKINVKESLEIEKIRFSPSRLTAALIFYIVLCLIWIFFAPLAAPSLEHGVIARMFVPFEWPLPEFRRNLALSISEHTLSFIIPLAFGMYMYPARRAQLARTETAFQTFAVVFSIQLICSVVVNFLFDLIAVLLRVSGEFAGVLISFGEVKIWADVFVPSLAPGFALAIWILCRNWKVRWLTYGVVCFAGAASFSLCQFAYECISGTMRGYYWHEMLLGAFLTLAYFFAASIARDALRLRPPPGAARAPQAQASGTA